jgi:hypothetical protein
MNNCVNSPDVIHTEEMDLFRLRIADNNNSLCLRFPETFAAQMWTPMERGRPVLVSDKSPYANFYGNECLMAEVECCHVRSFSFRFPLPASDWHFLSSFLNAILLNFNRT